MPRISFPCHLLLFVRLSFSNAKFKWLDVHFLFPDMGEGDVCTQVEPGMNVVCKKNGDNCHMTSAQCSNKHDEDNGKYIFSLA